MLSHQDMDHPFLHYTQAVHDTCPPNSCHPGQAGLSDQLSSVAVLIMLKEPLC